MTTDVAVMAVAKFERFFRAAASLDVDKDDLRRHGDFVGRKLYDLLVIGQAAAKANGRDVIEPFDLPTRTGCRRASTSSRGWTGTSSLRQSSTTSRRGRRSIFRTARTPEARLPAVVGLTLALARSFKVLDPQVRNPATSHWERAFRIFDLLL